MNNFVTNEWRYVTKYVSDDSGCESDASETY